MGVGNFTVVQKVATAIFVILMIGLLEMALEAIRWSTTKKSTIYMVVCSPSPSTTGRTIGPLIVIGWLAKPETGLASLSYTSLSLIW